MASPENDKSDQPQTSEEEASYDGKDEHDNEDGYSKNFSKSISSATEMRHTPARDGSPPSTTSQQRLLNLNKITTTSLDTVPPPDSNESPTNVTNFPMHGENDDKQNQVYPPTLGRRGGAEPTPIRRKQTGVQTGPIPPLRPSQRVRDAFRRGAKHSYKYADIKAHDQIRLLKIQCASDSPNNDIIASVVVVSFDQLAKYNFDYDALSYHWGNPSDGYENAVYLRNIEEYKHLEDVGFQKLASLKKPDARYMAKPNLYHALMHLRPVKRSDEFFIWIDAICINQNNSEEKKVQVARMTQIYTMAGGVIIWLGIGNESSSSAIDLIKKICGIGSVEEETNLIKDGANTRQWSDLAELMKRSWFSRRWVIQEIALARDARVHCGDQEVHWRDFKDAISFFVMHFDTIKELFHLSPEFKHNANAIGDLDPLGAKVLVDETTNIFRRNKSGDILEPIRSLESLVCSLPTFESSDARDTIYALQNISRESPRGVRTAVTPDSRPPPYPDYEKDLVDVYVEFVKWVVITSSRSLDIICRQWALPAKTKLPSWIQEVTNSEYGTQKQNRGRKNGDSFVGLPDHACYKASHRETTTSSVKFEIVTPNKSQSSPSTKLPYPLLCATGIQIGMIRWSSDPIADGVIPKKCLSKGGWVNHDKEEVFAAPDKLWRTLVADRGPDGQNPPSWYHRACLQCLVLDTSNGHINTKELLASEQTYMVTEYLKRVRSVTWNRKFIELDPEDVSNRSKKPSEESESGETDDGELESSSPTYFQNKRKVSPKEERLFGLGPPKAKNNDIVCILFGCTVPCVLRKIKGERYIFIGEAYIYGKMDGEAVNELNETALKERKTEFKIK
jgi:hypothetical protein